MSLRKSLDALKNDVRMVDFNMNRGVITSQDWDQHINNLEDLSSRAVPLNIEKDEPIQVETPAPAMENTGFGNPSTSSDGGFSNNSF